MFDYAGRPGAFKLSAKPAAKVRSGIWYFGFDCVDCHQQFPVLDDPSAGKAKLKFAGDGRFRVKCPLCGIAGSYRPAAVKSFRQP